MSVSGKDLATEVERLLLEGWLEKESRVLKSWRKYISNNQTVVRPHAPLSADLQGGPAVHFAHRDHSSSLNHSGPQERRNNPPAVLLRTCCAIEKLETQEDVFYVTAESNSQREKWIGSIGNSWATQGLPS